MMEHVNLLQILGENWYAIFLFGLKWLRDILKEAKSARAQFTEMLHDHDKRITVLEKTFNS